MKICMYSSEFPPDLGGRSTYVYNLSKKLIERGHKVTVISRGGQKGTYYENVDGIKVYRVRYIPFYPFPFLIHKYFIQSLFEEIENDFDFVHVHGALAPVLKTSLPIIFTSHGTSKKDLDNMEIKSLHFLIVKSLRNELFKIEQKTIRNANVVTAVSESCAEQIRQYFTEQRNIYVVNNGVDTAFFAPSTVNRKERYVLYTGRLETRKGLIDLVESAKFVSTVYPDIKFVLTGKGTIQSYLEKRIEELGLKEKFYFAGFVNIATLREYYQKATIYVLPSYYEALPTTLLEAMSCGISSIATSVEGNCEVITDHENGLLIPPRNPKKLAEAIIHLLDDNSLRKKLGDEARKHIIKNYDWNAITDYFEDLYRSVVFQLDDTH